MGSQDTKNSGNDSVRIRNVERNANPARPGAGASTGSFVTKCGNNENENNNSDNFIVAPGVPNGAQHTHDYVGNDNVDANSTDGSLRKSGTTCQNQQDKSTYFWPVLRMLGRAGPDANAPGGGQDGNVGTILQPDVELTFTGSPNTDVTAMPRFLRVLTGDAKAVTNGPRNARPSWTCTGFEDRLTAKYPICPRGSKVKRVSDFPSCWDGKNTDSANHRTHIVFPDGNGVCPAGTRAVPLLRITTTYDIPPGATFAVDSFPDQKHDPVTDHNDFTNVMSNKLMNQVVACINSGKDC